MQVGTPFPLTLTLPPGEREQRLAVCNYSLANGLLRAARRVSLSLGERAGVRGNGISDLTAPA
jgi:hypothetical protein